MQVTTSKCTLFWLIHSGTPHFSLMQSFSLLLDNPLEWPGRYKLVLLSGCGGRGWRISDACPAITVPHESSCPPSCTLMCGPQRPRPPFYPCCTPHPQSRCSSTTAAAHDCKCRVVRVSKLVSRLAVHLLAKKNLTAWLNPLLAWISKC